MVKSACLVPLGVVEKEQYVPKSGLREGACLHMNSYTNLDVDEKMIEYRKCIEEETPEVGFCRLCHLVPSCHFCT